MRIKLNRNIGRIQYQQLATTTPFAEFKEGAVVDVLPDEAAKELIKQGLAEVESADHLEAQVIRGVPRDPAIGKAKSETVVAQPEKKSPTPENFGDNPHKPAK